MARTLQLNFERNSSGLAVSENLYVKIDAIIVPLLFDSPPERLQHLSQLSAAHRVGRVLYGSLQSGFIPRTLIQPTVNGLLIWLDCLCGSRPGTAQPRRLTLAAT